jgi:hypothetical protein
MRRSKHVAHGQYEVGGLLVYSAAVLVVLAFRDSLRLRTHENISPGLGSHVR